VNTKSYTRTYLALQVAVGGGTGATVLSILRKTRALNRLATHALVLWAACALAIVEDGEAVDPPQDYDQQLSARQEQVYFRRMDHGTSKSAATSGCRESSEGTEEEEEKERYRKQHDSESAHRPDAPARAGRALADHAAGIAAPPPRSLSDSVVLRL